MVVLVAVAVCVVLLVLVVVQITYDYFDSNMNSENFGGGRIDRKDYEKVLRHMTHPERL